MSTNAEIIAAVAQAVHDAMYGKRTKAIYAQILTDAQDWITEKTECLRKIDSTSVTLVASTQEYDLPSDFIKFPTEEQEKSPAPVTIGTYGDFQLEIISPTKLEVKEPGWREVDAGTPRYCYIIREGTLKLGFHPMPSASFISTNGSTVFIDMVFRGANVADNSDSPFDSSNSLRGLQQLLKFRAQWQIWMEDKDFASADRFSVAVDKLLEDAQDLVQSIYATPGPVSFGESVRQ